MAKKKKQTRKRKVEETVERSPFRPLSFAIAFMVIGALMLLGGFGTGGPLPVGLFHGAYWLFGWAAYLAPSAFLYWGIYKFHHEEHRIPAGNWISALAVLVFTAAWAFSAFATKTDGVWDGGHGGAIGKL